MERRLQGTLRGTAERAGGKVPRVVQGMACLEVVLQVRGTVGTVCREAVVALQAQGTAGTADLVTGIPLPGLSTLRHLGSAKTSVVWKRENILLRNSSFISQK